jgi:hypothetical protein
MTHVALVIPVPALEPLIRPRMQRTLPTLMFPDPKATHAHVSLTGPIPEDALTPALFDTLATHFAQTPPLSFTFHPAPHLTPDGSTYLTPEPLDLLEHLIASLPDLPVSPHPPHLTIEYSWATDPALTGVQDVEALLPVTTRVERAELNWYERHNSRTLASFAFGRTGTTRPAA